MALQPIVSSILIDFDDNSASPEQKAYQKQVYSAIKLNMNDLQGYEVIDKFTQCGKCKVALTEKDKGHVFDFQQVQSNPDDFNKQNVEQLRQNKFTKVLWNCAFCSHNNIVNNVDLRFAKNRTRVIQKEKMPQKRDPMVLIVFDISGSMQQLIEGGSGKNHNWPHLQKIKETKIYKKIVADQQNQLEQLIKSQNSAASIPKDSKNKYVDYLKKNKLLMGLTEHILNKINPNKKSVSAAQQAQKKINDFCSIDSSKNKLNQQGKTKTIGFMFFNSNVILSCDGQKTKKILLVDSNDQYKPKLQGFQRQITDFDSFESLFKVGQKYGQEYTNKISTFQFQNLDIKSMSNYTQGQTALGPAIVTALGVVSKHGQGSSIVVVTDGIGNKGIFDQMQSWDQGYKLLKMRLQKLRCFMTVLQFRKPQDKNKIKQQQQLTGLDKFCQRHDGGVVKKINVMLNQNQVKAFNNQCATSSLDEIQKKMNAGIDRDNFKYSNQAIIKCQHPFVSYSKSADNLYNRLFNMKQPVHIVPQFKDTKLTDKDYLHHFMTQILIKYQSTQTGEQCIFMSYIVQKFIKYSKMKPKDLKALDNQNTFMNVIEFLHNEEEQLNLDNLPLGIIRESFRKTQCMSPTGQKTLRFPSKHVFQKQSQYQWMQNIKKFEDQALANEQMKQSKVKPKKLLNQPIKKTQNKSVFGSIIQQSKQVIRGQKVQQKPLYQQQDSQDQYISL